MEGAAGLESIESIDGGGEDTEVEEDEQEYNIEDGDEMRDWNQRAGV